MTDSPEVQKLIRGLEALKFAQKGKLPEVNEAMKHYRNGIVDGISASLEGLTAARNSSAAAQDSEVIPGLDTAIATLNLALEMAKMETGQ